MKVFYVLICFLIMNFSFSNAEVITGSVNRNDINSQNQVVDYNTKQPLGYAKISIPDLNYTTFSDGEGLFRLNIDVNDKMILFVEKDGYKTFSLTIDNTVLKSPLKLGIEKESPLDTQISNGVVHLGDNLYSDNSANSSDFKLSAKGYYFEKKFITPQYNSNSEVVLKIGTIIGLDTKKAKNYGQNRIAKVYSSPMRVYVNNRLISIVELNGDNITIQIPKNVLQKENILKIETGINLFQTEYRDYDDVELANIRIEVKEKHSLSNFR